MTTERHVERAATIQRWLGELERSVEAGVPALQEEPEERLKVDPHLAAADCPAGRLLAPSEEFRDSARVWAREIGLVALRTEPPATGGFMRDPIADVLEAIAEPTRFRQSVGDWLEQLDRAERAAVAAAAAAWMADALALAARHGEPEWHTPVPRSRNLAAAKVTVSARVDAVRSTSAGPHLLVLAPRRNATDARLARRVAVVSAVSYGEVPAAVHIGHRDSHTRYSHRIDDFELGTGVEELTEDIGFRLRPSGAVRVPGPQCRWCTLADDCPEGSSHLEATRGAPFPSWLAAGP